MDTVARSETGVEICPQIQPGYFLFSLFNFGHGPRPVDGFEMSIVERQPR